MPNKPVKTEPKPEPQQPLINMAALAELLRDDNPAAPSELIEMVDAIILYFKTRDEEDDLTTDGLEELMDARADYRGPGIIH